MIDLAHSDTDSFTSTSLSHSTKCLHRNSTQSKTYAQDKFAPFRESERSHYLQHIESVRMEESQRGVIEVRDSVLEKVVIYDSVYEVDLASEESVSALMGDLKVNK